MTATRFNQQGFDRRRSGPLLARRAGVVCSLLATAMLAALLAAVLVQPLRADGLEGRFEIRSADLELRDGVYHLNARLDLPISDAVRRGLTEGVPLSLELDLDIKRVRQLLPNSSVAELTQRYHLQYNAVSARYILRNDNSGQQQSLGTVDEAIEHLSEVHSLPALDKALIARDRRYEANVRARIDFGSVPFTMRLLMFWVSDWHRECDWYAWTFQP
ncbi:MAG TPA: DUF4390 domain-containing protein [Steroidobacteraceae bacterium]|nr:DUF4390 domain-containing protein [Steroidobacteraceae bacterium]